MKKYIKASSSDTVFDTFTCEGIRFPSFMMHETPLANLEDINDYQVMVDECHPYDLQDYIWARIGGRTPMLVLFVDPNKNGAIVDRLQLELYNPDIDYRQLNKIKREKHPRTASFLYDLESSEEENQQDYIDYCLTLIAQRMRALNKKYTSRIDHT